jgi:hypothetical protein
MPIRPLLLSCLVSLCLLSPLAAAPSPEELSWDALVPEDFRPENLFEGYNLEELDDSDPRAADFMRELKAVWKAAPVVDDLAGKRVKMPGFVVPLETSGERVTEFFLVPYFGACIHVPPPPANQMIYVRLPVEKGLPGDSLYTAVWVSGQLQIKRVDNALGTAGYLMESPQVEPYEEE